MLSQQFSDFWLSVLLFVLFSTKVQAQVSGIFINEILSSNAASDYDAATSDYPDWIEIFNSNSSSVNFLALIPSRPNTRNSFCIVSGFE